MRSRDTVNPRGLFRQKFLPIDSAIIGLFEYDELAISQRRVKIQDVVDYGAHLLGQHTVRLSPIGYVLSTVPGLC